MPLQSLLLASAPLGEDEIVGQVLDSWSLCGSRTAPVPPSDRKQSSWHSVWVNEAVVRLSGLVASDPHQRARWSACQAPHAGDWLHALPISSIGLRLDDEAVRLAVGLHLGVSLCSPHQCTCCTPVTALGTHGLSCRRNKGRVARHAALNDMVYRACVRAGVAAVKEPA